MKESELYDNWLEAKKNLAKFKSSELELRNKIIQSFIEDQVSGTVKVKKGAYSITIGLSLNNSLDEDVLDTIWSELTESEKGCIKTKPSLIAKELNNLTGHEKLFEAITVKPRQPTLKISIDD